MEKAIEINNLTKSFGKKKALNNVCLTLDKGESLTLFGPNGAGKTTLIKIISTLLHLSSGDVSIFGQSIVKEKDSIRRFIGIISHDSFLYPNLSAEENLCFYAKLYDVPEVEKRAQELLKEFNLYMWHDSLVRTFSRGMIQRLAIARAIVHNPHLIFLDEPYTGLDPQSAESLTLILHRFHEEQKTIILTTHDLEKGWENATKIAILVSGELRFLEDKKNIQKEKILSIYLEKIKAC